MFDKSKFALIIKKIKESYPSQEEFSKISGIGRTYLSQYMNMKIDNPPKPKILEKLADASKGIVTYEELMQVCGYYYPQISRDYANKKILQTNQKLRDLGLTEKDINFIQTNFLESNCDEAELKESVSLLFDKNASPEISNNIRKICDLIELFHQEMIDFYKDSEKNLLTEIINREIVKLYPIPVYGKISAGIPNWAEECLEGYLPIDPNLMGIINPDECFFLLVNGQSMNKVIRNGAYALIRKQDIVENGEICAVLVNGFEATLKKFSKQGDLVILEPVSDDPSFTTQVYNKDTEIRILGKYIGKFEMNK